MSADTSGDRALLPDYNFSGVSRRTKTGHILKNYVCSFFYGVSILRRSTGPLTVTISGMIRIMHQIVHGKLFTKYLNKIRSKGRGALMRYGFRSNVFKFV